MTGLNVLDFLDDLRFVQGRLADEPLRAVLEDEDAVGVAGGSAVDLADREFLGLLERRLLAINLLIHAKRSIKHEDVMDAVLPRRFNHAAQAEVIEHEFGNGITP